MPGDCGHFHHIETPFKEAASRFVPKVMEAKIVELCSLDGTVVRFLHRVGR